jgi:hypothetical protein
VDRNERLAAIRARNESATPGPWRWVGNTDNHEIHLENKHWVILGTQRIERTENDRDIQKVLDYLWECGDLLLSDADLLAQGVDLDDWKAVEAAQEAALRPQAVEIYLQDDEWGNPRWDERIAMRTTGDDTAQLKPLEEQARYNVCPEAETRDDPRVYRADYTPRSPDAEFIAHARADIEWLLYEVDRLSSGWSPND